MLKRTTFREIKDSLGRYIAILAIVALGVGFFSGLKVTREAMVTTADSYLAEHKFFDYEIMSTLGFEQEDVEALAEEKGVAAAEGAVSVDALYRMGDEESDNVIKFHSITDQVNTLIVTDGRLPESDDECVIDHRMAGKNDIGKKIILSEDNSSDTTDMFKYKEYTITGIVVSPYYLNFERGSTSLGNGTINGFAYILEDGFNTDYYTSIFLRLSESYPIYSDEYKDLIDQTEEDIQTAADRQSQRRYEQIISDAEKEVADGQKEYDENYEKFQTEKANAESQLGSSYQQIITGQNQLNQQAAELQTQKENLEKSRTQVQNGFAELEKQRQQFEANKPYMTEEEIAQTEAALSASENELQNNLEEINSGLSRITSGEEEIASARETLADSLAQYNEARAEADAQFSQAEAELDDARQKLKEARQEIDDIETPDTYVLDRNSNVGYACFESDSNIVDGIAKIFPVFFFLVAALVCMTTMTRMVEEQRTQIGVLKALGYSNGAVIGKYLFYSGSAAFIGCVAGFFGGCYLFPMVIWKAYCMMYDFSADLFYIVNVPLALISLLVSLLCSMGATFISCYAEFREVPAQLIRPKAPKNGKRIFLERIGFIWKRISFLYKVSFRNIFRYKKRFFMMVLGISGCTALLVAGLGVRDSVKNVVDYQYDEIQVYDYSITFDRNMTEKRQESFSENASAYVDDLLFIHQGNADFVSGRQTESVNLIASDSSRINSFIDLHTQDGEKIDYPKSGEAVICRKLADTFGIDIGDTITLRDDNRKEMDVKVSGICENYVYNYIYVTPTTCLDGWGYTPEIKTALVNVEGGTDEVYSSSARILNQQYTAAVSINNDLREQVDNMMSSLDYVIALVVLSAGVLAFIVLYNLTNINITERIREIATIKVLGFFPRETSSYVFRENFFLTAISAVVGLALGKWLHTFIMEQIQIDMMAFDIRIAPLSYLLSVVLTFLFAILVNLAMYYKLDKISMTESLKSIE